MTHGMILTVPSEPPDPKKSKRTFWVSDSLWAAATAKARSRNETIASVIVRALERYVRAK